MKAANFDKVAPFYDLLAQAIFGRAIKRSQTVFLHHIPEGASILIIGGGTGWIIREILKRSNPGQITFIEASKKMLAIAQRKNKGQKNIHWILGTQDSLPDHTTFDVIFTGYFLDVFSNEELPRVVTKLSSHLRKGGLWLFADFVKQNWLVKTAYFFFRITTGLKTQRLPDYDIALKRLDLKKEDAFYRAMIKARIYTS